MNDTIFRTVEHLPPLTIPFSENFEGAAPNWNGYGQNNSWQVGVPTGINLSAAFLGSSAIVTNLSGNYKNNEVSYFETPCITYTQPNRTPIVSFYINHSSEPVYNGLILELSNDHGSAWQIVNAGSIFTNWYANTARWEGNSNGCIKVENYLDSAMVQNDFKLRFKITSDGSVVREGFAIDEFKIRYQDSTDLSIEAITYPSQNPLICGIGNEFIRVELKSNGRSIIDSTRVKYRVNNGPVISELVDSTILSGQRISFRFSTPYDFSASGTYSVDVWINTRNDPYALNDSILNYQIINSNNTVQIDTLPFFENFDGPQWVAGPSNAIASDWSRTPATG